MSAATAWIKWDKDSPLGPQLWEWCLWSVVINGKRNYFSGELIEVGEGQIFLQWDGFARVDLDDTVYYARVKKLGEA